MRNQEPQMAFYWLVGWPPRVQPIVPNRPLWLAQKDKDTIDKNMYEQVTTFLSMYQASLCFPYFEAELCHGSRTYCMSNLRPP